MARQDAQTEYIVTQEAYNKAVSSLPQSGHDNPVAYAVPIMARQYRQNVTQTVNAGKWTMWAIANESFAFTWANRCWNPPANLVIMGT